MSKTTDILIIGAGPAGTYLAKNLGGRINELILVDKRNVIYAPIICGELIPSSELLENHIPKRLHEVLKITLQDTLKKDFIVNKINHVEVILGDLNLSLLPFKTYVVSKGKVISSMVSGVRDLGHGVRFRTFINYCTVKNGEFKCKAHGVDGEYFIKCKVVVGADAYPSIVDTSLKMNTRLDPNDLIICTSCKAYARKYDIDKALLIINPSIAPGGYAWIFPRGDNTHNVGIGVRASIAWSMDKIYELHMKFMKKFELKPLHNIFLKTLPIGGLLRKTHMGNAYLIGDAVGSVIPTNGAGINPAMITSYILSETLLKHERYDVFLENIMGKFMRRMLNYRKTIDLLLMDKELMNIAVKYLRRNLRKGIYYALLSSEKINALTTYTLSNLLLRLFRIIAK